MARKLIVLSPKGHDYLTKSNLDSETSNNHIMGRMCHDALGGGFDYGGSVR